MIDIIKLAFVLLIVSAVSGLSIVLTNKYTAEKIEQQKINAEKQALQVVFPTGISITKHESSPLLVEPYWSAKKNDTIIGYAFKGSSRGCSGDIKFIVGIGPEGTILGLNIFSQSETPGMGARIQEIVSQKYLWNGLFRKKEQDTPWFTRQFKGINVTKDIKIDDTSEWHTLSDESRKTLIKENTITAITGATISTEAVCSSVKKYAYKYLSVLKKKQEKQEDNTDQKTLSEQEKQ